ncbi:hypothetical protein ABT173_05530 [Streptomyces sp. NPDC001795]
MTGEGLQNLPLWVSESVVGSVWPRRRRVLEVARGQGVPRLLRGAAVRSVRLVELLDTAFQRPRRSRSPAAAVPPSPGPWRHGVGAPGRVAAAMVTVIPPGIPVLMPGESVGGQNGPLLRCLAALESFDRRFPGFRSETHGVTLAPDTGDCLIECLRPGPAEGTSGSLGGRAGPRHRPSGVTRRRQKRPTETPPAAAQGADGSCSVPSGRGTAASVVQLRHGRVFRRSEGLASTPTSAGSRRGRGPVRRPSAVPLG